MKKILVFLILLLTLNINSAEFSFEAYGSINIENSVVTKNKEYTYFSYKNFHIDNFYLRIQFC